MEKPDANGYVNISWPSKNVPHGGIFHTRVPETCSADQQFLKALIEESKLSIALRSKDILGLRQSTTTKPIVEQQTTVRQVRPRTSRRRSLSAIRESGVFDIDQYRPTKRGEDREKMKERLAHTMAFGDSCQPTAPPPPRVKLQPKLPTAKQTWNELVTQIRERAEWLAEMEYLGEADPHREIIQDQIAERMRALDALALDSELSSARSSASGFSTKDINMAASQRSASRRSAACVASQRSASCTHSGKGGPVGQCKDSDRIRTKVREENVANYGQLSPLQYSPRRRV